MKSAQLTREAFEKWFAGLFGNKFNGSDAGRFGWYYFDDETDLAWQSWQAALQSLPAPDAAQESAEQAVKREPVAWLEKAKNHDAWFLAYSKNPDAETRPLYAHPAQSEREIRDAALEEAANLFEDKHRLISPAFVMEILRRLKQKGEE